MKRLYYIHSPNDWSQADVIAIREEMERLQFQEGVEAAKGEGAGGAGFETVVEVVLNNPIVTGLISTTIFEIAKYLWTKRPTKKKLPEGLPERLDAYRLVVHVENENHDTIIGIDLKAELKDIETAVTVKLEDKLKQNPSRIYQNGDDWDIY